MLNLDLIVKRQGEQHCVTASNGQPIHADLITLAKAEDRRRFACEVERLAPGIPAGEVEAELLRLAVEDSQKDGSKVSSRIEPERGANVPDYVPFPVDVLPAALADLVSEGAKALGCDPAQIALPALAACGAAIGNSRRIILKLSWREPVVIWAVTVLPSGALKSPAMDLALEPIRAAQRKAIADWREGMEEYQARHGEWEDANKKLRGAEPMPPVCARITVSDITVEALADRLQVATRGLLCDREEVSGLVKGFNQYKSKGGGDVAHWLTIHGARTLFMDRKTGDQKMIFCAMAFVSIAGTIQPATLRRALTPEYMESGFAARLLLAMPPVRRRQWSEAVVSERTRRRYAAMLAALLAIPVGGTAMEPEPVGVPMTLDAKEKWIKFYNDHNLSEQAGEGGDLAAAWSKIEGYCARLALIIHMIRAAGNEADPAAVDVVSMEAGIVLARWFGGEAERVYAMLGGDGQTDEHGELVSLIRDRGGRIKPQELREAKSKYHAPGAARDALCRLVEGGYGRWVYLPPGATGGRPVEVFEALPSISGKPPYPVSGIRETPRENSASGGIADTDTPDDAVLRMQQDDRDYSAGNPDEVVEGVTP